MLKPFLRFPLLAFVAPLVILPKILFNLIGCNRGYLLCYLLLLPVCLVGNLVWAAAFRQAVLTQRQVTFQTVGPTPSVLSSNS